nr:uncharacterized protein LOC117453467 [Pseudochaenichthys georgianus]
MSDKKKKKKQQRDLLSFWAKLARSEETVEEALDLSVNDRVEENECPEGTENETAEETEDDDVCGFDPEDLTVDVGYWFKGSTNRKGYLTDEKQPWFRRLLEAFSNPMTEVYLLFYQATLPVFSTFSLLLQREKSSIFLLHDEIRSFIRKLLSKFLKPAALQHQELHDILYKDPSNQLPGEKLVIGFTTRGTLNRLLDAGVITPQQVQRFQQAAVAFLVRAVESAMKKLPMREPLIKHAMFLDVQQRVEGRVFSELLPYNGPDERDKLGEEFLDYQSMDIAMPEDPATFDIENFWGNMASMKNKVTGMSRFGRLSRIAKLVLVLPHSNADAERVFSVVGLNKTKTRNSLALDGTLSSIMTVKMANLEPQCFKWEPPPSVIKASKSATNTYNMRHVM